MNPKALFLVITASLLFLPGASHTQVNEIKIVPVGESIKPEVTKRRYRGTALPQEKSFLVELASALSSGINRQGQRVYIRASENVASKRRPAIRLGALGEGIITQINDSKKRGKLVVELRSIEAANGKTIPITGEITLSGNRSQAFGVPGERFTAQSERKQFIYSRKPPRKRNQALPGYLEIQTSGLQANLRKGQVKGKLKVYLEAPNGFNASDIDPASVFLYKVNGREVPPTTFAKLDKSKQGDFNKNGTTDWQLHFSRWDFIKYQPSGTNTIELKGRLNNGKEFVASDQMGVRY